MNQLDIWMLIATLVMAIGTAVMAVIMWMDRSKRAEIKISPQPVKVAITDELHDRFASREDFLAHCRDNEKQREKLHGRIDDAIADYNQKFQNLPGEIVALLRHTGALK